MEKTPLERHLAMGEPTTTAAVPAARPAVTAEELQSHCATVVGALSRGRLVPFLGAGANLCDRPESTTWRRDQSEQLPAGGELAQHLATLFRYPGTERELARVSQYAAVMNGTGPLYDELRLLFDADYPVNSLHASLASWPAMLRDKGYPRTTDPFRRRLLAVTTNYDDLLDRAFLAAGEPCHLVWYMADGEHRGRFFHRSPDGEVHAVEQPNSYQRLQGDTHPVVLKIHGGLDRRDASRDSFVITEDHYIDYLSRTDVEDLIPVPLPAMLRNSHLLFLGYGLQDWNLRVILHRIWGDRKLSWKSWAIQRTPDMLEKEFWRQRGVDILAVPLRQYVASLAAAVGELKPAGAPA